jgi:hypothetical protein
MSLTLEYKGLSIQTQENINNGMVLQVGVRCKQMEMLAKLMVMDMETQINKLEESKLSTRSRVQISILRVYSCIGFNMLNFPDLGGDATAMRTAEREIKIIVTLALENATAGFWEQDLIVRIGGYCIKSGNLLSKETVCQRINFQMVKNSAICFEVYH